MKTLVDNYRKELTPREIKILELRYGLIDDQCRTLKEIAKEFEVTCGRIRQVEVKALERISCAKQGIYIKKRKNEL
mgnify:FL=1